MGLTIYEICHVQFTYKQRALNFKMLKSNRMLSPNSPYVENEHIEYELIMKMTV